MTEFSRTCRLLYRRIAPKSAQVAGPHKLTKANVDFARAPECQSLFGKMKTLLSMASVLSHPDFRAEFTLDMDASNDGIGAVLGQ